MQNRLTHKQIETLARLTRATDLQRQHEANQTKLIWLSYFEIADISLESDKKGMDGQGKYWGVPNSLAALAKKGIVKRKFLKEKNYYLYALVD